jgi:putative transposase
VQRLWREEGLRVPVRRRKRRRLGESTVPAERLRAERPNHVWAFDFQFDQTADGRALKLLNIVDEFTREALQMLVERNIDADATTATLDRLVAERGAPAPTDGQRPRDDRERAPGLVSLLEHRDRVHRAGLAVAEPVR